MASSVPLAPLVLLSWRPVSNGKHIPQYLHLTAHRPTINDFPPLPMPNVGILTDASAHLLNKNFPGAERVHIHPLTLLWEGGEHLLPNQALSAKLPPTLLGETPPRLILPSRRELRARLHELALRYDSLLILPMESTLSPLFQRLLEIADETPESFPVYVMDTHTFGVGLGWLVRQAALLASMGKGLFDLLSALRPMRERIYTMLCIESLTYLHHTGLLDPAQAIVGEMLGLCPLFVLEDGRLVPMHKARSGRHMLDLLEDFAGEFGDLAEIAIVYGARRFAREARHLQSRLRNLYPHAAIHMAELDAVTAATLGPRTIGVFVME